MFKSALDPFFRDQVEAQLAAMAVPKLVQGRVAWWTIHLTLELQNVLGGVLRGQLEGMRRPLLDGADVRAGRKLVLGGLFEKMNRGLDAPAGGYVNAGAVLEPSDRLVTLAVQVVLGFIDEDEGLGIDRDASRR